MTIVLCELVITVTAVYLTHPLAGGLRFSLVPAAAVVTGWFQRCVFLSSDWSAPPLSAELTDETEHPSVCPLAGSSYHSGGWEGEMKKEYTIRFLQMYVPSIGLQTELVVSNFTSSCWHWLIGFGLTCEKCLCPTVSHKTAVSPRPTFENNLTSPFIIYSLLQ